MIDELLGKYAQKIELRLCGSVTNMGCLKTELDLLKFLLEYKDLKLKKEGKK